MLLSALFLTVMEVWRAGDRACIDDKRVFVQEAVFDK